MSAPEIPEILRLLEPSEYEFYRQLDKPPEGWPPRNTLEALEKSDNKAHDNARMLVRENDKLRAALIKLHKSGRFHLRIFILAMCLTWSALGWMLSLLIPYAVHGMAK